MFKQFQNLSSSFRTLAGSVGWNEEEWRARGLERFDAVRNEFQNLNSLLAHRTSTAGESKRRNPSLLSLEATDRLLQKFREDWIAIYDKNKETIAQANKADELLVKLLGYCEQHQQASKQLQQANDRLAIIQHNLDAVNSSANNVKQVLGQLEDRLNHTLEKVQRQELETWKQQQEAALRIERETKMRALEERKQQFEKDFEEHNQKQTQSRIEVYDATFQAAMDDYRQRREHQVSTLYSENPSQIAPVATTLESLRLDHGDTEELNDFFQDGVDDADITSIPSTSIPKAKAPARTTGNESDDDEVRVEVQGDEDYEDI